MNAEIQRRPRIVGLPDDAAELWDKSIPDTFTVEQAVDAVESALRQTDAVATEIKASYHGTIPPPPWPRPPSLVKARETMLGAHTFFTKIGDAAPTSKWKRTDKAGVALIKAGANLFTETSALEAASRSAPTLPQFLKKIPDPRSLAALLADVDWKKIAIGGAVAYFLFPEARRLARKLTRAF